MTTAAPTSELERLAHVYEEKRLRPIIDPVLDVVLINCPRCKAQDSDPLGMWRPARVVPRGRQLTVICEACGQIRVTHVRRA